MANYKVGDRVRIVSECPDELTFVQSMCKYLGKVLTVKSVEEMPCGTIYKLNEAAVSLPWIRHDWIFKEEWIAGLAEPQTERHGDNGLSVVIRFHGNKTTARLMRGETIVKTATARRNPADNYSHAKGAALAMERLFAKGGSHERNTR